MVHHLATKSKIRQFGPRMNKPVLSTSIVSFIFNFQVSPPKTCIYLLPHTYHMPQPNHYSWFDHPNNIWCPSRWACVLRFMSAEARLLGLRFRISLKAWVIESCICCVSCRWRLVRRADHLFVGVLLVPVLVPVLVCVCVCVCVRVRVCVFFLWSRKFNNEAA